MIRATNDASLSKLGDIYQYYNALLDCFTLEKGDSLLIEVCGDVSILSYKKEKCVQKEIKHHVGDTELSDRHVDFWKTIKNWVTDYETSTKFEKLEFYTTSSVPEVCKFNGWNEKNTQERYGTLIDIGKQNKENEKTFRKYYNAIFNDVEIETSQIKEVLAKVTIVALQLHIQELSSEFDKHISYYIPEKNRIHYIDALLGELVGRIKNPPYRWEITKDEFDTVSQLYATSFINDGKKPLTSHFTDIEPSLQEEASLKEKRFVKEIERIEYYKKIPQAISDYWKMNKTVKKYFDDDPTFNTSLLKYRANLKRSIDNEKDDKILDIKGNSRQERILESKKLYVNVMKIPVNDFGTIVENQPFFQCGVVHDIVDEGEFIWYIGEEDEY